jgi:hypothetical protein
MVPSKASCCVRRLVVDPGVSYLPNIADLISHGQIASCTSTFFLAPDEHRCHVFDMATSGRSPF